MLGYIIGPAALGLLAGSGGVAIAVALMAALAAAGAVGWSILRRRRHVASQVPGAATTEGDGSAYGSWADAACRVCLTIAVVRSGPVAGRSE